MNTLNFIRKSSQIRLRLKFISSFRPSLETFGKLLAHAEQFGSFDGGDQGLFNSYFSDWSTADISRILPFGYNVHAASTYTYAPAYKV